MAYYTENVVDYTEREPSYSTQFDLYHKLGEYLTHEEVKLLMYLLGDVIKPERKARIRCGRDLFLALEDSDVCDDELLRRVLKLLKTIRRYDVVSQIHYTEKRQVLVDPLEEFLATAEAEARAKAKESEESAPKKRKLNHDVHESADATSQQHSSSHTASRKRKLANDSNASTEDSNAADEIVPKLTCDVRLRVRAEYCNHENALIGQLASNKPDKLENQFERFNQANTILKSRDLGYIVCDIKFSEITYLDAFWRDYLNGSLLEALKGVFITESLKQAVGNEAIKLLVHVDEDDYERGRLTLFQNLHM